VDEVCEHAEGGDLGGGELVILWILGESSADELTNVTISKKRQKAKNIPKSILKELMLVCTGVWRLRRG
jgi:hypothetical protein